MNNGIGNRIDECFEKLKQGDGENAFIQLSLAIEGTSKLAYPDIPTSAQRNKQLILDSMPFVLWSLTNGTPTNSSSFNFMLDINGQEECVSLENVMYKLLRCSLVHEGKMPNEVEFADNEFIAIINGKLLFPFALITAYCWAVIVHPVNKDERLIKHPLFKVYGSDVFYNINDCWGNEDKSRSIIRKGFLYDVEQMLKEMNRKNDKNE